MHCQRYPHIVLGFTAVFALAVATACSPGSQAEAPPYMELDREALAFGPTEDIKPLLVMNTGGSSLTFTAQVSASSGGVAWLQATPEGGAVDAGSATTVLVLNNSNKFAVVAFGALCT